MSTSPPSIAGNALFFSLGAAVVLLTLFASARLFQKAPPMPPVSPTMEQVSSPSLAVAAAPPVAPPPEPQSAPQLFSPENIRQLVAPIALYPDALIALIMPASTVPSDVVLASRYLEAHGDPQQIPSQPWDSSVQSLANYPQIITWMDQNLEWTTTLGQAFIAQQADVMDAIQLLRAQARAAGNLVSTPEQTVVIDNSVTRILPTQTNYIYVPQYNPEIVYVQPSTPYVTPIVSFGVVLTTGPWLDYDFDWHHREVCRGNWQPGLNSDHGQHGLQPSGAGSQQVAEINKHPSQVWHPSSSNPSIHKHAAQQRQLFISSPPTLPSMLPSGQLPLGLGAPAITQAGQNLQRPPSAPVTNFAGSFPPNYSIPNHSIGSTAPHPAPPATQPGISLGSVPSSAPPILSRPLPPPPYVAAQPPFHNAPPIQKIPPPIAEPHTPVQSSPQAQSPYAPNGDFTAQHSFQSTQPGEHPVVNGGHLQNVVVLPSHEAPPPPAPTQKQPPSPEGHQQALRAAPPFQPPQAPPAPVAKDPPAQKQTSDKDPEEKKKGAVQ